MNLKKLYETRAQKLNEMEAIFQGCEERAMTEEEAKKYDELAEEVRAIDETLDRAERLNSAEVREAVETAEVSTEAAEERAFAAYCLGQELRAGEQNITYGNNGAIIPVTIANRIIKKIKDICPILAGCTLYNVKGDLRIPVWTLANTSHDIAVGYQTEFTDITADAGKFTSVDLSGYLAGALVLVGKSVENNGSFSVVSFIIDQMAEEIAAFIEKELLVGTNNKCQGALASGNTLTAAGTTAITFDELITLQGMVKQAYQSNACWTMNPATFTAIKKLKDANNQYILQNDPSLEFPYRILGRPVYLSDNMPALAASAKTVLYGDYSGLSVNFREDINIQVLQEKYATQHAIGIVGWFEFDSKVSDEQKLAVLVQHA